MIGSRATAQVKCSGKHEEAGFCASFILRKGNLAGLHLLQSLSFPVLPVPSVRSGRLENGQK